MNVTIDQNYRLCWNWNENSLILRVTREEIYIANGNDMSFPGSNHQPPVALHASLISSVVFCCCRFFKKKVFMWITIDLVRILLFDWASLSSWSRHLIREMFGAWCEATCGNLIYLQMDPNLVRVDPGIRLRVVKCTAYT